MRITSGLASLSTRAYADRTERDVGRALKELASGSRFNSPGADPAGMAIAQGLQSQVKGYQAALKNTENATSFVAIAEGALAEQNNITVRLRELAVQAASDTLSDVERGFLNDEYQQLTQEFDRIAKSTKFGSQGLLNGATQSYEFQVGVHKGDENVIKYTNDTNTTASNVDLDGLSVETKSDARDALEYIDTAMLKVNAARAKLGAVQSRMDATTSHLQTQSEAVTEASSRLSDTDVADAVARVRRGQILSQYQAAAIQLGNEQMQNSLRLIV